mmetsp:Transcript_72440/g.127706  ORF Transcript_72440/g.127706 Transcript_72440/m.127706 type:complete len:308 (-) Transcript_72440:114-1037(-)
MGLSCMEVSTAKIPLPRQQGLGTSQGMLVPPPLGAGYCRCTTARGSPLGARLAEPRVYGRASTPTMNEHPTSDQLHPIGFDQWPEGAVQHEVDVPLFQCDWVVLLRGPEVPDRGPHTAEDVHVQVRLAEHALGPGHPRALHLHRPERFRKVLEQVRMEQLRLQLGVAVRKQPLLGGQTRRRLRIPEHEEAVALDLLQPDPVVVRDREVDPVDLHLVQERRGETQRVALGLGSQREVQVIRLRLVDGPTVNLLLLLADLRHQGGDHVVGVGQQLGGVLFILPDAEELLVGGLRLRKVVLQGQVQGGGV